VIIYDIKCENGHKFEGWFKDRQAWIEQNAQKLVSCPVCNSSCVELAPSSPVLVGKDSRAVDKKNADQSVDLQEVMHSVQQFINKNFEDVGNKFAEVALKIHNGEEEKRNIRGTTTSQEETELKQEGVQFVKIPLPKMDS